jgi:hypothetical protein
LGIAATGAAVWAVAQATGSADNAEKVTQNFSRMPIANPFILKDNSRSAKALMA